VINLFKKPQHKIYAGLLLLVVCWVSYVWFIPDINQSDVGIVKKMSWFHAMASVFLLK
jgi:hypothetical protein